MNIGLIGNDTSHVEIFSSMLHDIEHPYYVNDAKFVGFIECYSEDLPISRNRAEKYKQVLHSYLIPEYKSIQELNARVDAWWIMTVDGRNHLDWFVKIVSFQKPIFIDKPMTIGLDNFDLIVKQSEKYQTPIFSSSSLRFSEILKEIGNDFDFVYAYGPLPLQEKMPGYYWYGIHSLEWLDTLFNCELIHLKRKCFKHYEIVELQFEDGRRAIFRGEYDWTDQFGGIVHYHGKSPKILDFSKMEKSYYVSLLDEVIQFYKSKKPPFLINQTRRIFTWIEKLEIRDC
ncbi:Gfo/Idh/MocA family oxidoreductase [Ureibacillus acetophenoni]|uniref:Gfo/Idh/MocA-like oxidoreductase N-terminal domain-containing protein n=1 Tax=Ureibacillus acetophenoni TaxID=614649 RepID=A0A285UGC9_9BACL|nr:Gfo/Idh/MocA family oxidoreductase [Ureibacillus acetophenoni]SOC40965.1 hypothetical protein SAMN05877842_10945 [Ureibacillus acetophenoni]